MKKSDLKTGMTLRFADSDRIKIVLLNTKNGNELADLRKRNGKSSLTKRKRDGKPSLTNYFGLDSWNEDLTSCNKVLGDIVEVYSQYGTLIWSRKKEFKTGWYVHKKGTYEKWLVFYNSQSDKIYGWDINGKWIDGSNNLGYIQKSCTPFNNEKVITKRLLFEANKRGFKTGVTYQPLSFDNCNFTENKLKLNVKNSAINIDTIFDNGQWATIIKPEYPINKIVRVISGGIGALGANGFVGRVCTKQEAISHKNYNGEYKEELASLYVINELCAWGLMDGFTIENL